MKKLILTAAAVMFAAGATAQQQTPVVGGTNSSYSYENAIQVTGEAKRQVTPDEIFVRITIRESEMKLKKTVEQAEQDMIARLKNIGIDTDGNLTIDRMSSGYKDYFLRAGQPRTTATYELKVTDAAQLGLAYQALEAAGISNMAVVRQSHSKIEEIQRELRVEAIGDARRTAEDLVGALGQKLGPAVYIVDFGNNMGGGVLVRGYAMADRATGADAAYQTPLDFSDMNLSYSVTVKFALDGK